MVPSGPNAVPTPARPAEPAYQREEGYAVRYRDRRFQAGTGAATHRREVQVLRALLARAQARPGAWLDVPAGAGRLSDLLPGPVVQVDRDPAMLRAAGVTHARVCASVLALPFPAATFAGALCHRLLQHLPHAAQRVGALAELARVTDGPIVVSYFDAVTLQHARRWLRARLGRSSGRVAIRFATLRAELAAAGLRCAARQPLLPLVSEQTLVLAVRA